MGEGNRITEAYASYIRDLRFNDLPEEVVSQSKRLILDTLGCTIGGSKTEIALILLNYIKNRMGISESTMVGYKRMALCRDAAFINAQAAHILDYDETYKNIGHPAGPTIYPALAIGEMRKISGKDLLVAFVVGYDIASRIASAMLPSEERRKQVWPFGTFHVFGSVSAASKVLSLDKNQIENALGIAGANAPMPSTRRYVEKQCMIKNCEGWAAGAGVDAALLAKMGFTGLREILDGDTGFWVMAGSDHCEWDLMLDKLGEEFKVMESAIKPYPICKWAHSTLDAFHTIMRRKGLSAEEIEKCTVKSFSDICGGDSQGGLTLPKTMEDAWTNLKWGIAMVSLGIDRGPAWFRVELFKSKRVLNLMRKIKLQTDPVADKYFPEKILSTVEVIAKNGERYIERVEIPRGDPQNPLSWGEVKQKFKELALPVIGKGNSNKVVMGIEELEKESDITQFTSLLRPNR